MVRIIVPVNFSSYSLNALNYAITLGNKIESEIELIHTIPPLTSLYDEEDGKTLTEEEALKKHHNFKEDCIKQFTCLEKNVREELSHLSTNPIILKTRCVVGYPEDVLVDLSISEEPNVIVMGTKSKGETIKELLGSVTSDVIKNAVVPVLAVPAQSSIDLKEINRVLFVSDFGDTDYRSLHKLMTLLEPFETKVYVSHFTSSEPDKWDKEKLAQMRYYCEETYRNYHIEFDYLAGDDFISSLDEFINTKGINLIAMTKRKRNMISKIFHPSITRKVLFHTDIPLLVFHE